MGRHKIPRTPCEQCGQPTLKARQRYCSHACSITAHTGNPDARFWSKVEKTDDCWLWRSASRNGYGRFTMRRGHVVNAHHHAWTLTNGPIRDGLWVLHRCDRPLCVRPDHLFLGTHRDNMADMIRKGRASKSRHSVGEGNPAALLTESDVRAIRVARAHGETLQAIGQRFHVTKHTIFDIAHGRSWTHVV